MAGAAAWKRFVAPYYVLNALALLSYALVREHFWNPKLAEREGFLNIPREHEIFLLAVGSCAVNYRKKATLDGVIAMLFLYGKMAVLAAYYYMDRTVCGWYFVYIASEYRIVSLLAAYNESPLAHNGVLFVILCLGRQSCLSPCISPSSKAQRTSWCSTRRPSSGS